MPRKRPVKKTQPELITALSLVDGDLGERMAEYMNGLLALNGKEGLDIHRSEDKERSRRNGLHFDMLFGQTQIQLAQLNGAITRMFINAGGNDESSQKQYFKAEKLGTDAMWSETEAAAANAINLKAAQLNDVAQKVVDAAHAVASGIAALQGAIGRPVANPTGTVGTAVPAPARSASRARPKRRR